MTVRQKQNESLRDFLSRFRNAIAEIPDLIEQLAINYLAAVVTPLYSKNFLKKKS